MAIQGEDGTRLPAASQDKAAADVIVVADNHKNDKKGDWKKVKMGQERRLEKEQQELEQELQQQKLEQELEQKLGPLQQ